MPEFDPDAALAEAAQKEAEDARNADALRQTKLSESLRALHESELGRLLYARRGRTLFYPACCVDWQPLIRLNHLCDTFLYCDLGMSLETFTSSLPGNFNLHPNLRLVDLSPIDSDLFDNAETGLKELFPGTVFAPRYAPRIMGGQKAILEVRMGDCVRTITLIYLNQEGIAAYYGLYASRGASPRVICRTDNGFMHNARWEEPLGRLVEQSREKPQFLLDGIGYERRNNWPWRHVWQVYKNLIPYRLDGCCYSRKEQRVVPKSVKLSPETKTGGRSVMLRREPLLPKNIGDADAILVTEFMAADALWPQEKTVIILHRKPGASCYYARESVLFFQTKDVTSKPRAFNQLADICRANGIGLKYQHPHVNELLTEPNEVHSMRNILDKLTCFCRAHGIKRLASVPIGLEHEGCELADWQAETGSELHITFYCETPGDYYSLSNHG